jgi:hypothetical protein
MWFVYLTVGSDAWQIDDSFLAIDPRLNGHFMAGASASGRLNPMALAKVGAIARMSI